MNQINQLSNQQQLNGSQIPQPLSQSQQQQQKFNPQQVGQNIPQQLPQFIPSQQIGQPIPQSINQLQMSQQMSQQLGQQQNYNMLGKQPIPMQIPPNISNNLINQSQSQLNQILQPIQTQVTLPIQSMQLQSILNQQNQTSSQIQDELDREDDEQMEKLQSNNTLYINNLHEKIAIEDLKRKLRDVFSKFGKIVEIIAKKNIRMRGQAFIIFEDLAAAEEAKNQMHRQILFEKKMRVNFAKSKSDIIARQDGSYVYKERQKLEMVPPPKKEKKIKIDENMNRNIPLLQAPNQLPQSQTVQPQQTAKELQKPKLINEEIKPNNLLFVQELPDNITEDLLKDLFIQYNGFREVRMIPARKIAFVEYDDEFKAKFALENIQNLPMISFKINFAKK